MKKIKMILPMLIVLAAAFTAFAFKPAKTTTETMGWYVYDPLAGDKDDPTAYTLVENYNPNSDGCDEGVDQICAIYAPQGLDDHPAFTGDPEEDTSVEEVRKRDL